MWTNIQHNKSGKLTISDQIVMVMHKVQAASELVKSISYIFIIDTISAQQSSETVFYIYDRTCN